MSGLEEKIVAESSYLEREGVRVSELLSGALYGFVAGTAGALYDNIFCEQNSPIFYSCSSAILMLFIGKSENMNSAMTASATSLTSALWGYTATHYAYHFLMNSFS